MSESALTAARRLLGPKGFCQSEDEWRHDAETVARALLSEHDRLTEEVARLRKELQEMSESWNIICAAAAALPKETT